MKTDYVCSWRDRIARGSPWGLRIFFSAVLLLLAAGTAQSQNLVTGGSFGTTGSCDEVNDTIEQFNPTAPGGALGTWLGINKWMVHDDEFGDNPDCFASFDVAALDAYNRGRLIQGFVGQQAGLYSVDYEYVYENGTIGPGKSPYFWVLGVNSSDPSISQFSGPGDGFPDGPGQDITNWDVLYQKKLAGDCGLTDCDDGPSLPVGSASTPISITDQFHVPAIYDYWVVVVSYGCNGFNAGEDCPNTLRGLDDVVVALDVADDEGPYTKNVAGEPNASIFNTTFEIVANVDDTNHGNSNIDRAEFMINHWGGGLVEDWTDMDCTDGTCDSPIEDVTYTYVGGLPVGDYEICVRGYDVNDNEGNTSCARFVTYDPADAQGVSFQLSNECAQFYTLENEGAENEITTLHYGENIVFDADFRLMLDLDINGSNVNFKYSLKGNGSGYGVMSGILYQFKLNQMARFKSDLSDFNPTTFEFKAKARIVGQAQEVDGYGILNGAQNNAEVFVTVRVHYAGGHITQTLYDWGVECAGDPWQNLMEDKDYLTREPVERGYGKETNKYGWAGLDYHGLLVGTKNAWYDILTYINGDGGGPISTCIDNPPLFGTVEYPEIYWRFACMEIYGTTAVRTSEGAELWRWDYEKNKRWMKLYDAVGTDGEDEGEEYSPPGSDEYVQGFRDAVEWDGKACFAADRGAFISGVSYETTGFFPGVAILCSEDGINFEELTDCPAGLCGGAYPGACGGGGPVGVPTNNVSIRALASYKPGRKEYLMIGTLNSCGGEIWSYDGSNFRLEKKFDPDYPIVGELEPYDGDLYIGLGGALTVDDYPDNDYLWKCHGCGLDSLPPGGDFAKVDDLPDIDENSLFVIKLFTAYGKLFAGTVNFVNGFSFLSYDANTDTFDIIADGPYSGGFFDHLNIYLWAALSDNDGASTGDINGRIFIGTFNPSTITEIPRGTAELYYSDDGGVSWTQYPMPIGWSLLGYGIRNMVACDDGKFLCLLSATNMVAPDLIDIDNPLAAGLQVWAIMNTKVASPSGPTIKKGKGKNK